MYAIYEKHFPRMHLYQRDMDLAAMELLMNKEIHRTVEMDEPFTGTFDMRLCIRTLKDSKNQFFTLVETNFADGEVMILRSETLAEAEFVYSYHDFMFSNADVLDELNLKIQDEH